MPSARFANPHEETIGNEFVMRTPATADDVERIAAFNAVIHGAGVAGMVRSLLFHCPGVEGRDFVYVEDTRRGEIVSSLCLVPWTLRYAGVSIPVGEMGLVGTLEAYRRRGLVRAQSCFFMQRMHERGCLLSAIQGIPTFYRQFGYEYALPLEGGVRLDGHETTPLAEPDAYALRLATIDDAPALAMLFDAAAGELDIHCERTAEQWRYLLMHTPGTEMEAETWLVAEAGHPVGYFRLPAHHFGAELAVNETSHLSYQAALAVLQHLRDLVLRRSLPGIRLNLPDRSTLVRVARSLGAHDLGRYAWQIHVPDRAALLRSLAPVLEQRLADSPFAALTDGLQLCFYRDSVILHFVDGKLRGVDAGDAARGAVNFPLHTFIPLLLGHRTWQELRHIYADVSVAPSHRLLIETLFPPMNGFLYPSY